jgi:hypothetical protein
MIDGVVNKICGKSRGIWAILKMNYKPKKDKIRRETEKYRLLF